MIELAGIEYKVDTARILSDVTLSFRPGGFNAIIGPNGAGKSTLLKIAAGRLAPTGGTVRFDGADPARTDPLLLARKRAVLSQQSDPVFPLSAEDVVLMGRYPHFVHVPSRLDRQIVREALDKVGMRHKSAQSYATLSGGEKQKIQLARVFAQVWEADSGPRVLMMDEPTTNLDIRHQLDILETAREFQATGCTIIAVLHDINQAVTYADRLILMADGRLAGQTDEPATLSHAALEAIFRVRASRISDEKGQGLWHFRL